jgi:hypothetical protein
MSSMTEGVVHDEASYLGRAVPALLGIAVLAVVAAGAAALIGRAGTTHRKQWLAAKRPSLLGEITRTVALNMIGVLAARLARRVPTASESVISQSHVVERRELFGRWRRAARAG